MQNAKLFRKPLAVKTRDGKFDRGGKRASSMPRDKLSAYVRAILTQNGFDPAKIPSATANTRARAASLETWRAHWFFGAVLKTDSKWWDRDYHGGLDSIEGKGETPEGFVQTITGNQRQQYLNKMKKTTLSAAPPPPETALVNISAMGGNGGGVHITGVHNSTITLSSADANNACVSDEVGLAVEPDAEEQALLERLEFLQLQRQLRALQERKTKQKFQIEEVNVSPVDTEAVHSGDGGSSAIVSGGGRVRPMVPLVDRIPAPVFNSKKFLRNGPAPPLATTANEGAVNTAVPTEIQDLGGSDGSDDEEKVTSTPVKKKPAVKKKAAVTKKAAVPRTSKRTRRNTATTPDNLAIVTTDRPKRVRRGAPGEYL